MKVIPGGGNLTVANIVETTGCSALDTIEELEILFLTCNEIASLENCRALRRLAMIDNGLQRISNLRPVAMTLTSLCLCDQMLTRIENLELPMLKELMLHRNRITEISGLEKCPRIKKLWLFQNKITSLKGLTALPDLEVCWLQANKITSLTGLEHCNRVVDLGLAGNPLSDFSELKRLEDLPALTSLSLSDIHFGQCTLALTDGYHEFVLCFLRQVKVLDGVGLGKGDLAAATGAYTAQVRTPSRHHPSSPIITHHHPSSPIITHHHPSSPIITHHHSSSHIRPLPLSLACHSCHHCHPHPGEGLQRVAAGGGGRLPTRPAGN